MLKREILIRRLAKELKGLNEDLTLNYIKELNHDELIIDDYQRVTITDDFYLFEGVQYKCHEELADKILKES